MLLVLLALWILFNGRLTLEIFLIGLLLCSALTWFCWKFLDYSPRMEKGAYKLFAGVMGYVWLLLCEIVKSNLAMMKYIYGGKRELKPKLVTFTTPLKSQFARNVLSNSITLTPGTITAMQEGQKLTVHCLDEAMAEGVEDQAFQQKLMKIEQKAEALRTEKKEAAE
ncbi:MAG: Na+/H+ antiporter subunit E [Clostridia bacterium]|nr:Na+/H+ antiporter subunit E [Clostridia bacterium]